MTVAQLRQACQIANVNVQAGVPRRDIVHALHVHVAHQNANDPGMLKVFPRLHGTTGGWIIACCPHEIVYAAKLITRSEGAGDVLDVLRSFVVWPRLVFYDNAGNLAAHIRNVLGPNFLGPHEGRLGELTPTFVGQVDILSNRRLPLLPQPGPDARLILYDGFHFSGARSMSDRLRTPFVLSPRINTQAAEHLNSTMLGRVGYRSQMNWQPHFIETIHTFSDRNARINMELVAAVARATFRSDLPRQVIVDPLAATIGDDISDGEADSEDEMEVEQEPIQ